MASNNEKRGLGRGLSALMADMDVSKTQFSANGGGEKLIPIEKIRPNPNQPRREFGESELEELATSIRERGVIQPLILRVDPQNKDGYEIVAGERRWRASQMAQLHEVPAIIRAFSDSEVLEVAIIENIQRENLNPIDEALSYRQLMERFGHTQEKVSQALGKSRSHIANLLRLLNLPEDVLAYVQAGKLSVGHARALVVTDRASEFAKKIVNSGLSVRQTEALVKKSEKTPHIAKEKPAKDVDTLALEADLSANVGKKVEIDVKPGVQHGIVRINFKNFDELDEICQILVAKRKD